MDFSYGDYQRAAEVIHQRTALQPTVGIVLGSGLGKLADAVSDPVVIPYADLPGWPRSTVEGHVGQLVIGQLEGRVVVMQQGRAHFYEGYTLQQVTFPIRVMAALGVKTALLTNAAGGLNPAYNVGDLMLLNDHINMVGMAGHNPLVGIHDNSRFVGMSHTYDRELRQVALKTAAEAGVPLHEGVYVCLAGPNFETPAEVRMLRALGGDAVGMSTVHEVLVARHAGMRVLACSGITNKTVDTLDSADEPTHAEVQMVGARLAERLIVVLRGTLQVL